jgi:glycosyltransferase involved in cell wall biosynthesis
VKVGFALYAFEVGGMETFLMRLGRHLMDKGVEVEYLVTGWEGRLHGLVQEAGLTLREFYQYAPLSSRLSEFVRCVRRERYDVLFLNHSEVGQAAIPFLPLRTTVIPIFHNDARDIYALGCRNAGGWNAAIGPSTGIIAELARRVPNRPAFRIPYGVPMAVGRGSSEVSRFDGGIRLLYVGRIEEGQKGILLLPQILAGVIGNGIAARLTVIGSGPDEALLRQRFHDLGIEQHVEHVGPVEPADSLAAMRTHDILLLPSNFEGLCISLLEAMMSGCVPIASYLSGVTDDAVVDGIGGRLVSRGSVHEFVTAVSELARDQAKLASMREQAISQATRKFSIEVMGEQYLRLIGLAADGGFRLKLPRILLTGWDAQLIPPKEVIPASIRRFGRRAIRNTRRAFPALARQSSE